MNAVQTLAASFVGLACLVAVFCFGYKCGSDTNKPIRDERGRFIKRIW